MLTPIFSVFVLVNTFPSYRHEEVCKIICIIIIIIIIHASEKRYMPVYFKSINIIIITIIIIIYL